MEQKNENLIGIDKVINTKPDFFIRWGITILGLLIVLLCILYFLKFGVVFQILFTETR